MTQNFHFTELGFLYPHEKITIDLATFEQVFVKDFPNSEKRKMLFDNYLRYIEQFSKEITTHFTQWINGSFVTMKEEPNDIDFVTFIDADIHEFYENNKVLDKFQSFSKELEHLDAYILDIFPQENENFISHSLKFMKQWERRYSCSKPIDEIFYNKGFLEINFGNGCKNYTQQ